jgi:hypothetical protein
MVTLLDTIQRVGKVWRRVTEKTLHVCFSHVVISSEVHEGVDVTEKEHDAMMMMIWLCLSGC